jgi:hypothetical protein
VTNSNAIKNSDVLGLDLSSSSEDETEAEEVEGNRNAIAEKENFTAFDKEELRVSGQDNSGKGEGGDQLETSQKQDHLDAGQKRDVVLGASTLAAGHGTENAFIERSSSDRCLKPCQELCLSEIEADCDSRLSFADHPSLVRPEAVHVSPLKPSNTQPRSTESVADGLDTKAATFTDESEIATGRDGNDGGSALLGVFASVAKNDVDDEDGGDRGLQHLDTDFKNTVSAELKTGRVDCSSSEITAKKEKSFSVEEKHAQNSASLERSSCDNNGLTNRRSVDNSSPVVANIIHPESPSAFSPTKSFLLRSRHNSQASDAEEASAEQKSRGEGDKEEEGQKERDSHQLREGETLAQSSLQENAVALVVEKRELEGEKRELEGEKREAETALSQPANSEVESDNKLTDDGDTLVSETDVSIAQSEDHSNMEKGGDEMELQNVWLKQLREILSVCKKCIIQPLLAPLPPSPVPCKKRKLWQKAAAAVVASTASSLSAAAAKSVAATTSVGATFSENETITTCSTTTTIAASEQASASHLIAKTAAKQPALPSTLRIGARQRLSAITLVPASTNPGQTSASKLPHAATSSQASEQVSPAMSVGSAVSTGSVGSVGSVTSDNSGSGGDKVRFKKKQRNRKQKEGLEVERTDEERATTKDKSTKVPAPGSNTAQGPTSTSLAGGRQGEENTRPLNPIEKAKLEMRRRLEAVQAAR